MRAPARQHTADCGGGGRATVINEFSASTTDIDVEYVAICGGPSADLSGYVVLEIEGDSGTPNPGTVDDDGPAVGEQVVTRS